MTVTVYVLWKNWFYLKRANMSARCFVLIISHSVTLSIVFLLHVVVIFNAVIQLISNQINIGTLSYCSNHTLKNMVWLWQLRELNSNTLSQVFYPWIVCLLHIFRLPLKGRETLRRVQWCQIWHKRKAVTPSSSHTGSSSSSACLFFLSDAVQTQIKDSMGWIFNNS